jgi:hypothetical protein
MAFKVISRAIKLGNLKMSKQIGVDEQPVIDAQVSVQRPSFAQFGGINTQIAVQNSRHICTCLQPEQDRPGLG